MNIKADEQFKSEVKSICKQAEQDFVNALIRFHQRQISSSKREQIRGKSPKNNETARKTSKRKVMQSVHSQNTVSKSNVNRIANGQMEKLGQCN